ncbi:MAG: hypothetical protein ACHQ4G_07145 [Opitutales bacterium]
MLCLALTTAEKLQRVPVEFWLKLVMIIAIFVLAIVLIRGISQMNKVLLTVLIFVLVVSVGFNWIYERNEPAFLTPFISDIARFFPTKPPPGKW